jgi:hypothetical protein
MAYNLYQSVCNLGCEYLQLLSAKTIHSVRSLHPLYPGPPKPNGLNPVRCYETQKNIAQRGMNPSIPIFVYLAELNQFHWPEHSCYHTASYGDDSPYGPCMQICVRTYIYIHNIHKYIYIPIRCISPSQIPILDGSLVLNPIFISILWI